MEILIEDTKYDVALGFGNVMQIQGMLTEAFAVPEFDGLEISEDLTIDDLAGTDNTNALAASAKLMPLVIAKVLKKVNGNTVDIGYIDEEMPIKHGMELFNHIMGHIGELNSPKASEASLTQ